MLLLSHYVLGKTVECFTNVHPKFDSLGRGRDFFHCKFVTIIYITNGDYNGTLPLNGTHTKVHLQERILKNNKNITSPKVKYITGYPIVCKFLYVVNNFLNMSLYTGLTLLTFILQYMNLNQTL